MNPIRRYYVVPIVIAIVSIIAVFGFGSSDTIPDTGNFEPVFMDYEGQITRVIDGDTLIIDLTTIRLSLVNSPERGESGYQEAKDFASKVCPGGYNAKFTEDAWQKTDKYGRSLGLGFGKDKFINEVILNNGKEEITTYF